MAIDQGKSRLKLQIPPHNPALRLVLAPYPQLSLYIFPGHMGNGCFCSDLPLDQAETIKEITMNGVIVSLARGSPAAETSDMVMQCLDLNLHPKGPAASMTWKQAGITSAQRVKEKWREGGLVPGTVFTTAAGKLIANEILHVVCPEEATPQEVQGIYSAVMIEMGRRQYQTAVLTPLEASKSVSLPKQAELCIHVLAESLRSKKLHKVQRIRLVTPSMEVARVFEEEFDRHFPKWIHSHPEAHLSKPISN